MATRIATEWHGAGDWVPPAVPTIYWLKSGIVNSMSPVLCNGAEHGDTFAFFDLAWRDIFGPAKFVNEYSVMT